MRRGDAADTHVATPVGATRRPVAAGSDRAGLPASGTAPAQSERLVGLPPVIGPRTRLLVLETDAPDIPPQWLYVTAARRAAGEPMGRNEPAELPRIAAVLAGLRGIGLDELAAANERNARAALPRLAALDAA